jgi:basic amino acid/polyamine antiporter, APA family
MDFSSFSVTAITRRRPLTPSNSTYWTDDHSSNSSPDFLQLQNQSQQQKQPPQLQRHLNLIDIIFYGVGCSVGAGIYSLVGIGAHIAGPSIALSFLLCGCACIFTSLSYAEFAARVPLAGSAYTFTYVSFGELCGWLVGWNLTLGYGISAAVVARSWADYVVGFLQSIRFFGSGTDNSDWIIWLTKLPVDIWGFQLTCCPLSMLIIGFCTLILITGVKESSRFNTAMTILNLSVLGFVLLSGVGTGTIVSSNLHPVFPHGLLGMARGAALVFFAYLGFDMVACLSEEVQNPEVNMPIGIIGSLMASMAIYTSVSIAVVGMAPISLLGSDVPVTNALLANACCAHDAQLLDNSVSTCLSYSCNPTLFPLLMIASRVISFGAIFGLTTATFACLMGQPRIFYSMAQDGLLFKIYARVHPKTGVPTVGTILTGVFTALLSCFLDLESLANAISLGTLQVFTFVNAGVILLRMRPTEVEDTGDNPNIHSEGTPLLLNPNSPIVRDPRAAAVVRSLRLIKKKSRDIRIELGHRGIHYTVHDNGSKPVWLVLIFTLCTLLTSASISNSWNILISLALLIIATISALGLFILPRTAPPETFACPFVPLVPLLGILCNTYMMGSMPSYIWYIISVWLFFGLSFYCIYGIHHSELRNHGNLQPST